MTREEAFKKWAGSYSFENNGGWSEEVWAAAWDTALIEASDRLRFQFPNSDTIASISIWLRGLSEE